MVVVTSRNELIGLVAREGAQPLTLDLLTAAEAYQLLASRLGTERLTAEPEAVSELVQRCARLPLALAIIAARAAAHPTFPLATFAAELADAQRRLDAVDGGDQSTQVRSVFSWSYERLSQPAAQLFRLLGLQAGPDITVPAAASLIGVAAAQARQLLTDLARAHLVTEHSLGRYTCHDLLSAYAREQALAKDSTRERDAAVSRLLDYYLQAAARADIMVMPHRRRTPVPASGDSSLLPVFPDQRGALSWLEMNRGNLVAAVRLAAEYHAHDRCWRLANVQWGLFSLEKHWDDWIATHELGLASARVITDQQAQFTMLSSLGTAYRECGQLAKAYRHNAKSLAVSRTLGDQQDEAQALNGLGTVCSQLGQLDEAREQYDAALRIRREIGDRWGEAITTCNLGELDLHAGRLAAAEHNGVAALEIRREIGDRWGEAVALNLLGQVCQTADERHKAVRYFRDALAIHREVSDYAMEAQTLHHLGIAYDTLGEPGPRDECLQAALEIYTRLGMPAAEQVLGLLRR